MGKSLWSRDHRAVMDVLKAIRIELDLSQVTLAQRLEKPQSHVSKIESGERMLNLPDYLELCRKMKIDPGTTLDRIRAQAGDVRFSGEQSYNPEMPKSVDPVALLKTKLKRVSLRELARTIGCSIAYLSDVVNGKRDPGPKILRYLGLRKVVSVRWERE